MVASALQLQAAQPNMPTAAELRTYFCGRPTILSFGMREAVFYHERQLRPKLRAFLYDTSCSVAAARVLALIGDPGDLALVVRSVRDFQNERSGRWAYNIASALLEPSSDAEWSFLRAAALNEFHDGWADAGAIETLKLIASPRTLALLREVQQINTKRPKSCAKAIDYILSNPAPLRDSSLERLAKRVAEVNRIGELHGNKNTRYNAQRDKALIDIEYLTGDDLLVYTATFHKVQGDWRLRGVRETLQAMMVTVPFTIPEQPLPNLVTPPAPETSSDFLRLLPPVQPPLPPAKPEEKK